MAQVAVCSQINTKHGFNPLKTKRRPLYLKTHSVPCSPVTGPLCPRGFQEVQAPTFSCHSAHEGGDVVSLTHRPPFSPRKCPWYSFSQGAESTPGSWYGEKDVCHWKKTVTQPGIGPSTVRLVAQPLSHYATPGPIFLVILCVNHNSSVYLRHVTVTSCDDWMYVYTAL